MVNDNWLEDFGMHVAALSATALGARAFLAQVPEDFPSGDVAIVLLPRQGNPPDRSAGFRYPGLQIVHRSGEFSAAWSAAVRLQQTLDLSRPHRLGTGPNWTLITRVSAESDPYVLGKDETHAWLIACNYTLTLQAG